MKKQFKDYVKGDLKVPLQGFTRGKKQRRMDQMRISNPCLRPFQVVPILVSGFEGFPSFGFPTNKG